MAQKSYTVLKTNNDIASINAAIEDYIDGLDGLEAVLSHTQVATDDSKSILLFMEETDVGAGPVISLGTVILSNISTGGAQGKFIAPFAGEVIKVISRVTGNPGAQNQLSLQVNGGTAATNKVTIANGSSAGDKDTADIDDNNVVAEGDLITVTSDDGGSNNVDAQVTVLMRRTA